MKSCFVALASALLLLSITSVQAVDLRPDHPEEYIVKKGDTLWDIAAMFLKDPWFWPEVWHVNPQVENPHLIYPGDLLRLIYIGDEPKVTRVDPVAGDSGNRGGSDTRGSGRAAERFQPRARILSQGGAIPTLPLDVIKPFLTGAQVISRSELDKAAYVVSSQGQRLIMAVGDRIYVRGVDENLTDYSFFRPGVPYLDPDTGELLGYEAVHLGNGRIVRRGDPSTIMLKERQQVEEIVTGDRLLPSNDSYLQSSFMPKPSPRDLVTKIVSVYGGVFQIGQFDVVILNRGRADGMEVGHVQRVWRTGAEVTDKVEASRWFSIGSSTVKLPDEPAGEMMVFRVFERVSYALIMKATMAMKINDTGRSPNVGT